jgi:hypothetical protein
MNSAARSAGFAAGSPCETNCGRSVVNRTASFGFSRFVTSPCRNGEPLGFAATSGASPRRSERSDCTPR